ncbi:carotenoid oxygenase family protein [Leptothoe sp. PORK10 BA2]|uniref:carotenoid oxygenase family protein n=1 Tax=Leptothoe sp. PORK10 BA2 TaxID=3110254 RepID=UPI002B21508E|nr:carotenoid oxygenase family protein [Leptothoe sp. PORK10 BA2]MEA5462227.1 carotenoid oxygenase family protein [Leptothoe sp. PORK10 BA2]
MQTLPSSSSTATFDMDDWRSGYRSQPNEYDYEIDNIDGTIPPALTGTLFRNGPGLLEVAGHPVHHPFDGDGMITSIAISQGKAYFRNRYVRTAGYVKEQAAGKPLYRGVFGTQKPGGPWANAFDLRLKNIANTNVIYWGGKLLALWEAAEPHRLNPNTLETLGLDYLDGVLRPGEAFSAHPRIDPSCALTNHQPCLVNFGVKAGLSSTITLYEFDPKGRLARTHRHNIPGFAFLHDFAITPNYYIFFQNPVSFNPVPYLAGIKGAAECIQFNDKQPTRAIIIPRDGTSPIQTIDLQACFVFHHANAFETDGKLYLDSICYQEFPDLKGAENYLEADFNRIPEGQLWRFELDLATQTSQATCLIERGCEFPDLNPNHVGRPYRYLYIGVADCATGNAPLQAILKRDLTSGQEEIWSFGPRGFAGEPIFVPHPQGTAEDDGWILGLFYNAESRCSELAILDAQQITQGPVATLRLPHHIPYGLHGDFTQDLVMTW